MEDRERRLLKNVVFYSVLVIVLILLLFACHAGREGDKPPGLTILDGTEIQENQRKNDTGYISIPRYTILWVSDESPYVYLGNPPENSVYFRYYIIDEGGDTIYDSEAVIIPGKALEVDAYSLLGKGEHPVRISIGTYDINTQEPCNGAEQECTIIVE